MEDYSLQRRNHLLRKCILVPKVQEFNRLQRQRADSSTGHKPCAALDHSLQMHHLHMGFEGDSRVGQKPFSSIRNFDTAMRIFPLQYLFPDYWNYIQHATLGMVCKSDLTQPCRHCLDG
jgi:hypothetical protein